MSAIPQAKESHQGAVASFLEAVFDQSKYDCEYRLARLRWLTHSHFELFEIVIVTAVELIFVLFPGYESRFIVSSDDDRFWLRFQDASIMEE